jgi:hypothetical protein
MKLKINDIHYTEKYHPIDCKGCAFEDEFKCGSEDTSLLLNDMCIRGDRIYIKSGITEVLNYENSISK